MIPKIIHFCWLSGAPFPKQIKHCIDTWHENMPDFEIIIWDKNRIDINSIPWVKQAYDNKKYAFAADYIRFYALYNYGGIYLDTDVEVIKSLQPLLKANYVIGEEVSGDIEAAVIGAQQGAQWVKECINYYENRNFIKSDGSFDMRPVPLLINTVVNKYGMRVLPYYYLSPKNYITGKIDIKDNTFTIHHFDGKWLNQGFMYSLKKNIHKLIYYILGRKIHNKLILFVRPYIGH